MQFDLTPIEGEPFSIGDKSYVFREAAAGAAARYKNAVTACMAMVDGKLTRLENTGDLDPLLVSITLFQVDAANARVPVSLDTVKAWPHRVVKALALEAVKVNPDLETKAKPEKEIEDAKN